MYYKIESDSFDSKMGNDLRKDLFLCALNSDMVRYSHTGSKNVSGLFGLKTSLQVITVTRFSVSDRLIML